MRSTPDKDAQAREATALIPKNPMAEPKSAMIMIDRRPKRSPR